MKYQKSLDSFRAIAAIAVVLYHCNAFPAGWIGVHAFFVLSGFLITTILIESRNTDFKSYLGNFYRRRALRILPLYYGFLLVLLAAGVWRAGHVIFDRRWVYLATYTYNWQPFENILGSQYFGHLWSLCVEEQFYLFWPFLVYFVSAKSFRRMALGLVLAGPLLRLLTALWLRRTFANPEDVAAGVYFATQSHIDAFALGALFAAAPARTRLWIEERSLPIFAGCALLTFATGATHVTLFHHYGGGGHSFGLWALGFIRKSPHFGQYLWVYSILNVMSFGALVLFIHVAQIRSLLENRLLVFMGRISYGIYVWHVPIVKLYEEYWPCRLFSREWLAWVLAVNVSVILVAMMSYYGFEKFFIGLKDRPWKAELQKPTLRS